MTDDRIFIVRGSNLFKVTAQSYESEHQLQSWLEQHPPLLGQIQGGEDRQILLVRREAGIPGAHDAGDRWSLDHLFVDDKAWPVFVEVKRATDTRIRREVVAQMIDYVANATAYWKQSVMPDWFEETCQQANRESVQTMAAHLGKDVNDPDLASAIEDFWGRAWANLRAGRLFMVFVADSIPQELRRVVEFLSERMTPSEIVAVEVQRFIDVSDGSTLEALVPRVVGRTAVAEAQKSDQNVPPSVLLEQASTEAVEAKHRLDMWAEQNGLGGPREKGSSFQYQIQGTTAIIMYPKWESVMLWMHPLYKVGRATEARSIVAAFRKIRPDAGDKEPQASCHAVLNQWQYFEDNVLPLLLGVHESL